MKFSYPQIYLQEIPDEICLGISISGCKINCKNCHSKETWDESFGEDLTLETLETLILKNKYISCILFFGGEWDKNLPFFLMKAKDLGLKTALYSGEESMRENLIQYLDYYKVGPYIQELGGLNSNITNQKIYKINSGNITLIKFNLR